MPVIFKIFLFLLLKGGARVLKTDASGTGGSVFIQSSYIMPNTTVLHLQGDPAALEEALTICYGFGQVNITRDFNQGLPEGSKMVIQFEQMNETLRTRISHQVVLQLTGRVLVEWKAINITNI